MADFLSLLTAVPSVIGAFGGNIDPYKKQKKAYSEALANTSNPLYQQMYNQYRQQGNEQLSAGISEIQKQNRLANRMGRTPLLDQERGGESLFRNLMQGYKDVQKTAGEQTRGALKDQLNFYKNDWIPKAMGKQQQLMGYSAIENLIRGLSGNKKQYDQETGITWNSPRWQGY